MNLNGTITNTSILFVAFLIDYGMQQARKVLFSSNIQLTSIGVFQVYIMFLCTTGKSGGIWGDKSSLTHYWSYRGVLIYRWHHLNISMMVIRSWLHVSF